jgi:hypothetical protein
LQGRNEDDIWLIQPSCDGFTNLDLRNRSHAYDKERAGNHSSVLSVVEFISAHFRHIGYSDKDQPETEYWIESIRLMVVFLMGLTLEFLLSNKDLEIIEAAKDLDFDILDGDSCVPKRVDFSLHLAPGSYGY